MRLLLAPVEIPLKIAGRAARLGLQAAEGLVERVIGQETRPAPPARPATPSSSAPPRPAPSSAPPKPAPASSSAPPKPAPAPSRTSGNGNGNGASAAAPATPARPSRPAAKPGPKPAAKPKPAARPKPAAPPQAKAKPDAPDGTRADAVPTGATPVSPTAPADEDDVVYSAGPERDVAATIHVDAPFEDYDKLSAQELVGRLGDADAATKAAVALYEGQGRKRKSVLAAAGLEQR